MRDCIAITIADRFSIARTNEMVGFTRLSSGNNNSDL
jgi:hypothetical protein